MSLFSLSLCLLLFNKYKYSQKMFRWRRGWAEQKMRAGNFFGRKLTTSHWLDQIHQSRPNRSILFDVLPSRKEASFTQKWSFRLAHLTESWLKRVRDGVQSGDTLLAYTINLYNTFSSDISFHRRTFFCFERARERGREKMLISFVNDFHAQFS